MCSDANIVNVLFKPIDGQYLDKLTLVRFFSGTNFTPVTEASELSRFAAVGSGFVFALAGTLVPAMAAQADKPAQRRGAVTSVDSLDLTRYAGRWYEIARLPNSFQSECAADVMADYEQLPSGQIRVVNQCRRADGSMMRAEGRARPAERDGPASRLKVRFAPAFLSFLPMVWGNYWVLDLAEDYSAALVGDPGREYLWILSRSPTLADTMYERLTATAVRQGFDASRLVRSPASSPDSMPSRPMRQE